MSDSGDLAPDDHPPPLVSDSEGEENEEPGNKWDWFVKSELTLESVNVANCGGLESLKKLKDTLEVIIQNILSNESDVLHQQNILQLDRATFIQTRWSPLLTSVTSKYTQTIQTVTSMYSTLLDDLNTALTNGREVCEMAFDESEVTFTVAKQRLLKLQEALQNLQTHKNSVLEYVSRPLHIITLSQPVNDDTKCLLLSLYEEETDEHENGSDRQSSAYYYSAIDIVNSVENAHLECNDLIDKLNEHLAPLQDTMSNELHKVNKCLDELESWMGGVQKMIWEEPQRMCLDKTHPPSLIESSTGDEIDEVEDDTSHPELMITSQSPSDESNPMVLSSSPCASPALSDPDSPPLVDSPPLDSSPIYGNDSPSLPPPVFSSDEEESSKHPNTLDVSIDPSDEDFTSKVVEHILSPEATLKAPPTFPDAADITIMSTDTDYNDSEVTPTHSARPPLTTDDGSLRPPLTGVSEEFSPVDVGSELYNLDKTLENEIEYNEDEDSLDEDYDEGSKGASEDGSSLRTEDSTSNLEWIKCIGVFEYRLSRDVDMATGTVAAGGAADGEDEMMPYGLLINELEVKCGLIPEKTTVKDSVLCNANQLIDCLSVNDAHVLQTKLDNLTQEWPLIQSKLIERICQLKFEWSQTELILWFQQTVTELQASTTFLLLPDEIQQNFEEFKEYFGEIDQINNGEQLVLAVRESVTELQQFDKNEECFKRVLSRLEEAYDVICDKIQQQGEFLTYCTDQWKEFNFVATPLQQWMDSVEVDVLHKRSYGNTLDQSEQFIRHIVAYRQELPSQYELLKGLVAAGNEMSTVIKENSPAHSHVDSVVRGTTSRWEKLVEGLKTMEEELSNLLITWREYIELYTTAIDFIGHVNEIAGMDPLQSSLGDDKILPKFVQLKTEVDNFESRMLRLREVKSILYQHDMIGANDSLDKEMSHLETEWTRVSEVAQCSVDNLWVEHSEWTKRMLEKMEEIVSKGQSLLEIQRKFIVNYPFSELMNCCAAKQLLEDVQTIMTTHEDMIYDLQESLYAIQTNIVKREQMIKEASGHDVTMSEDKVKNVFVKWEEVSNTSNSLRPVLQLYCSQLHLVLPLQELVTQINTMESVTGSRLILEETLQNSRPLLSIAKFESLKQLSYDLDTVYREQYIVCDKIECVPSNQQLQTVNQTLTDMITKLEKQSQDLHGRLVLMVEWWKEYEDGHKSFADWFTDIKTSIDNLLKLIDLQEQSPHELLEIAQELLADVESHEEQYKSLTSTAQNLLVDMESKKCETTHFSNQFTDLKQTWSDIHKVLSDISVNLHKECKDLNGYLEKLGDFSERLNAVYTEFYDELCTAIPPNASPEMINRQKLILTKFNNKIAEMMEEFHMLKKEGERWSSKVLPEKWREEFREMSPGVDDTGGDLSHHSVERQLCTSENRLSKMNQMLKERALELELTQGDVATLMESANELLEWVESNLDNDFLHDPPPGELNRLLVNSDGIKAIKESFESKRRTLQRLHDIATSSKGSISEANLRKIEQLMSKLDTAWKKMEDSLVVSETNTEDVLSKVKSFTELHDKYNTWLTSAEHTIQDCLPIEADLVRLEEQRVILEAFNTDVLEHKRTPEQLSLEADAVLQVSKEGTGTDIVMKAKQIQKRFTKIEDLGAESSEKCEEAITAVQEYNQLEKEFLELLEQLKESYDALISKPNRPLGNIQETIDEHSDYCVEIESKSDVFGKMYDSGRLSCKKYPPSQKFNDNLQQRMDEWREFTGLLTNRWDHCIQMRQKWKEFEAIVKDFLEWLMSNGKSFSKDVTTLGGEKGVSDHMTTCENFKNDLQNKDKLLDEITEMAKELQPQDGAKPNGTKDVDSRLNDVSIHWNSVCELLSETLLTLIAVNNKLELINNITVNECEWLKEMAVLMSDKKTTHGVIDVLNEEIELHESYVQQFEEHQSSIVVIIKTEDFVLEHTSCLKHEEIKEKIEEISEQFKSLNESGKEYVGNLKKSVPLWELFNKQKAYLSQWIHESQQMYNSADMKPGNATVTKKSLQNADVLYEDIENHFENVQVLNDIMSQLSTLCVTGDMEFVVDHTESLTSHVNTLKEETGERRELLETRMESWKAFPVEAAASVQEFLDTATKEIPEIDDFENCSADELVKMVERLEQLSAEQSKRRGSASTLQSTASQQILEALAKNPDISEERASLLRGWSSTSTQLTSKLELLRLRADMSVAIEKGVSGCKTVLTKYHEHLSQPLPHSIGLEKIVSKWHDEEKQLKEECVEVVEELTATRNDYVQDPRIQFPKNLADQVNEIELRYQQLTNMALEHNNNITQQLEDWQCFKETLESFTEWLSGVYCEMKDISRYHVFLLCFQDILDRYVLVQNQVRTKTKDYHFLQQNHQRHFKAAAKNIPTVVPVPMTISQDDSNIQNDNDNIGDEVTDEREDINNNEDDDVHVNVSPVLEDNNTTTIEVSISTDVTPVDTDLERYQSQWNAVDERWDSLNVMLTDFVTNKEPWEKMANMYTELDEWHDEVNDRVNDTVKRSEEIYRLNRNPGPLTEAYQQFQKEVRTKGGNITELESSIDQYLTDQLRSLHLHVREFVTYFDMLKDNCTQLNDRLDTLAQYAIEKMEAWENMATNCIRRVPLLEGEVGEKVATIMDLEQQIGFLQQQPVPKPGQVSYLRHLMSVLFTFIILPFLLILLLCVLIIYNLDNDTLYHLFHHLQQRFSFVELASESSSVKLIL